MAIQTSVNLKDKITWVCSHDFLYIKFQAHEKDFYLVDQYSILSLEIMKTDG